ncbi:MAG: histidinol-phosphatase HisJ family protein [Candidatus Eisenbacteria bacterium]|nr:histidinol-phosphatase HisJ family protein [Candidatus Eisenbacteria bacterium]
MLLTGLVDYHLHTKLCGHARGEVEEYIDAARAAGLVEVGFADHFPLLGRDRTGLTMSLEELPLYYERVAGLRESHSEIRVKVGIEADYIPGQEALIEKLLSLYEFDYVLGSVHHIGDLDVSSSRNLARVNAMDFDSLYTQYFTLVTECAGTGLFDILAHPDIIKKHGHTTSLDPRPFWEATVEATARAGMCVEVNASGLRRPVKEIYPCAEFLGMCREARIPITLGSDAHAPSEVGSGMEDAVRLALQCGYTESVLFSRRKVEGRVKLGVS